jgi:hypothetical protein
MKTAVQQVFSELEALFPNYFNVYTTEGKEFINHFHKYLAMEKEQMKDSYKQGFAYRDTWNWELEVDWDEDSTQENNQEFEQYYNETFKPESNEPV